MAVDAFGLPATEILFAASAGWDATGAKWLGYPTFWVNRQRLPMDELGVLPDGIGEGMMDLAGFVERRVGGARGDYQGTGTGVAWIERSSPASVQEHGMSDVMAVSKR